MKFRKPEVIKFVKAYLPNFNFSAERSRAELKQVMKICSDMHEKRKEAAAFKSRKEAIEKRCLFPGTKVKICRMSEESDEIYEIMSSTSTAHLILKGIKGAWNPCSLKRLTE